MLRSDKVKGSTVLLLFVVEAVCWSATSVTAGDFDCNANGVSDAVDIRNGTSADCQPDGIPDECQVAEGVLYAYDAGPDLELGGSGNSVLALERFFLTESFAFIGGVEYEGVDLPEGTVIHAGLWLDPDGDGDPGDALLLASAAGDASSSGTGRIAFETGVDLGTDGTSFFVGLWAEDAPGWRIGFDSESLARQGLVLVANGSIDPHDLSGVQPAGTLCPDCDGDWTIRALGCDQPWCSTGRDVDGDGTPDECEPDCNGNAIPDDEDIASGNSTDCDANGVPDDCQALDDCDGDGFLDLCALQAGTGLATSYWTNERRLGPPSMTRVEPGIDFDIENGPPIPGGYEDYFAIEWAGALVSKVTGSHRLRFDADDRFSAWIDGEIVLGASSDPVEPGTSSGSVDIDLVAGQPVAFRAIFTEYAGNARCRLWWTVPGGRETIIPVSAFTPALDRDGDGVIDLCSSEDCNGNGLADDFDLLRGGSDCNLDGVLDECQPELDCDGDLIQDQCVAGELGILGAYFRSQGDDRFSELMLGRMDETVFFEWGSGSPAALLPEDNFAVRWTGTFVADQTGLHRFRAQADDGLRIWFDDVQVVDEWQDGGAGPNFDFEQDLVAGDRRAIRVEYYESGGDATIRLRLRTPADSDYTTVPMANLRPIVDRDGDGLADACAADCDGDGVSDATAIATGLAEDCNENGIPDACDLGFEGDTVVAWWRFDDPADLGRDSGPLGLHLEASGAGATTSTPVESIPRTGDADLGSATFDFSSRLTTLDPNQDLSLVDRRFTAEAWVRLDELANDASTPASRQWLFQRKDPTSDGRIEWAFLVQSGNIHEVCDLGVFGDGPFPTGRQLAVVLGTGSGDSDDKWCVLSDLQIEDGDWHHVSIGWDPIRSEVRFELDGEVDLQRFENRGLNPNLHRFAVGAHVNDSGAWNQGVRGLVDEARIRLGLAPLEEMLDRPYDPGSVDDDGNDVPDECDSAGCTGDLDGDGDVGGSDLGLLFVQWGGAGTADLDGDGVVAGADLGLLFVQWGPCR